jgi:hypothetical protein
MSIATKKAVDVLTNRDQNGIIDELEALLDYRIEGADFSEDFADELTEVVDKLRNIAARMDAVSVDSTED